MTKIHTRVCFDMINKNVYMCKQSYLHYIKYKCKHK